jgi:leucyl-tRNA---protein transferase
VTKPPAAQSLGFFTTPPHDCGYLDDRQAVTLFVDPRMRPDVATYTLLSEHGFRRSGGHIYRPKCPTCEACIPIRVPVAAFRPRRLQRRNLRMNADITLHARTPTFDAEHFSLYKRYIAARHTGGGMENPDPDTYLDFLTANWASTKFYEFRCEQRLLAVAVVDELDDGLSAVYTFYEPGESQRSLGRFAVLKEIELARERGLKWLYLGYWIGECRKMVYKTEYAPYQFYLRGAWRDSGAAEIAALVDDRHNGP